MHLRSRAPGLAPAALGALLLSSLAGPAAAQPVAAGDPPASDGTPAPPAVTPPRLLERIEPTWPAGEPGSEPVTVLLRITVEADGRVSEVEVVSAPSAALGAAAASALQRARFAPATRDGAAIRVRRTYEARLAPPPPAAEAPAVPPAPPPPPPGPSPPTPPPPHPPSRSVTCPP